MIWIKVLNSTLPRKFWGSPNWFRIHFHIIIELPHWRKERNRLGHDTKGSLTWKIKCSIEERQKRRNICEKSILKWKIKIPSPDVPYRKSIFLEAIHAASDIHVFSAILFLHVKKERKKESGINNVIVFFLSCPVSCHASKSHTFIASKPISVSWKDCLSVMNK